ncbi:retrovirus-related pol polyprotein from transposon RE1 [Tanacetum coccineum]
MAKTLGHTTSKFVWCALADAYSHDSIERMHTLHDSLCHLQKGTSTVAEFGRKIKAIYTFSTTQRLIRPRPKFRDLISQAESHELFLSSMNNNSSTSQVAFHTTSTSGSNCGRGASAHMTPSLSIMDSASTYSGNDCVLFGNGNASKKSHIGTSSLTPNIDLQDVLVVPNLTKNLLSVSKLTEDSTVDVTFSDNMFVILNRFSMVHLAQGRRKNGLHILERGLAMMFNAQVPASLWTYAFSPATYIINRLPSKLLGNKSSYELLFLSTPNYVTLDDSSVMVSPSTGLPQPSTSSIDSPSSDKHCELCPSTLEPTVNEQPSPETMEVSPTSADAPSTSASTTIEASSSTQPTIPVASTPSGNFMITCSKVGTFKPRHVADLSYLLSSVLHQALFAAKEPHGFKAASKHPKWYAAMCDEMHALKINATWDLVPRPTNANVVGSKWVFRTKFHSDGTVDRFKARLVAQGFTQVLGLDYSATFSPVVHASTVRIVLSLAVLYKWPLHQLDVKNAFLNGNLTDTVFMEQPPGFINTKFPNHVCRLKKALYGLKQAPRAWFQRLSVFLIGLFLNQSKYAHDILARAHLLDAKPAIRFLLTPILPLKEHHFRILPFIASAMKQPTVSRSSCESEYRALANTATEIIWITHLLRELLVLPPTHPTILCDNGAYYS